jgi:hypothetical protein
MATYTPDKILIPNPLDEVGLFYGMQRFLPETLDGFRSRLLSEARQPAGASEKEFIQSISRQVALQDQNLFDIILRVDSNGDALAPDAYVEITSNYFRAYSDYANNVVDIELSFSNRADGYFCKAITDALDASTYFNYLAKTTVNFDFTKSNKLRICNSKQQIINHLLYKTRSNKLPATNVSKIFLNHSSTFVNEKNSPDLVEVSGDYYIDYKNGVIISHEVQNSTVSLEYRNFPFAVFEQTVQVISFNDKDIDHVIKNTVIEDLTGEPEPTLINPFGAKILNQIFNLHPLTWGE